MIATTAVISIKPLSSRLSHSWLRRTAPSSAAVASLNKRSPVDGPVRF